MIFGVFSPNIKYFKVVGFCFEDQKRKGQSNILDPLQKCWMDKNIFPEHTCPCFGSTSFGKLLAV